MRTYILGTVIALAILISPAIARQVEAASLTGSQINSVIQFLGAFHADQSVIDNVRISLNGGTPILGGQSGINTNPTAPSCVPPMMWNGSVCAVQPSENTASTPTASITVNGGQKSITVNTGDTITKKWSSTNGTSWNATWAAKAIKGSDCIYNGKIGQHWNGLDGGIDTTGDKANGTESAPATADQVGCIFTITYVATNNLADKNAVSSIEITFPVNPTLSPSGSGNTCVAPTTTTTASPLNGVVYGPGATTGIIIEGSTHLPTVGAIDGTYGSVGDIVQTVRTNRMNNLTAQIAANAANYHLFVTTNPGLGYPAVEPAPTMDSQECVAINGDIVWKAPNYTFDPVHSTYPNAKCSTNLTSPNYKSATFTPIVSAKLLGSPLDSASSNKLVVMPIPPYGHGTQLYAPYGLTRSFQFTTGDVGESGIFGTEESNLGNRHALFINISTVPNDFRYDNFDIPAAPATSSHGPIFNGCAGVMQAGIGAIYYRVVNPNDPPTTACRVKPHTTYYINIRNENPTKDGRLFDVNLNRETPSRGRDSAYPTGGNAMLFVVRPPVQQYPASDLTKCSAAILNPTLLTFCDGGWISDPKNEVTKKYAGPDVGSTTTTTSGGTCTAPVASSGSGIDLCKQQGLDNIDETSFSKASMVEKTGFSSSNSDLRGYVYKMGPGQSYSFPVDSDTILLSLGGSGNTPARTFTVSKTVLEGNPYLGSFPHLVNVSQKKCDFNPSSTGCYLIDADSDTRFTGGTIYLPISASPVYDPSLSSGCHLQPGKQYYVNTRWIRTILSTHRGIS